MVSEIPSAPASPNGSVELPSQRTAPADANFAEYRARRTFGALDSIRAFSILAVIWHHAHGGVPSVAISQRGFLGVDMFFVLSGFLIVTLLLRENDRNGQIDLKKFYARRTLRIFPLYYAVIFATLAFVMVKPGSSLAGPVREELPYLLTYTSNWIHSASILAIGWSLATEEQFYLLWPPAQKYAGRALPFLFVASLLVSQATNFGLLNGFFESLLGPDFAGLEILNSTFTPILLGVGLAYLLHSERSFAWLRRLAGFPGAPAVAFAALCAAGSWPVDDISGVPRLSIQLAMTWLLATLVVREDHILRRAVRLRPIVRIGVVSYGMYLLHMFALHGARVLEGKVFGEQPLARFALCTALTYVLAELSFRFFESPLLRLKGRFSTAR